MHSHPLFITITTVTIIVVVAAVIMADSFTVVHILNTLIMIMILLSLSLLLLLETCPSPPSSCLYSAYCNPWDIRTVLRIATLNWSCAETRPQCLHVFMSLCLYFTNCNKYCQHIGHSHK